ncbi:MAG: hypothetical protein HGA51_01735 [Demequinaceae bacterium]|nr:hypothetical protein [Demequinaceae bacterium]
MRVRVVAGVLAALGVLSGCSILGGDGSLEVPQGYAVCAPAHPGGEVLFGVLVTNTGSDALTITDIAVLELVDTSAASVRVDLQGAALDDLVGAVNNPADNPLDQPKLDALLARLVAPPGAVIEAGATADIIVTLTPSDPESDAAVSNITIDYKQGGWSHTATAGQQLTLAARETC